MKYNYQNISISKDFYKSAEGFSKTLERLDPSEQYRGTELAGYDAFQRRGQRPAAEILRDQRQRRAVPGICVPSGQAGCG